MDKEINLKGKLCIKTVSKWFETEESTLIHVLDNINLQISLTKAERKIIVFLGPSGCGKTTLLRIIAGLEEPTRGEISYEGKKPERGWASVVFQEFSLFPWCTVVENVEFGLRIQGIAKKERQEKALSYLKKVGLEQFAIAYPHELSGGMKQRVAVARSIVIETPLMLMDEPFGALDALTREKMYDFIWEVWDQTDLSIILVTHNVEEAVLLGDTIYILSQAPARIIESKDNNLKLSERLMKRHELEESVRSIKEKILSSVNQKEV